MSSDSGNLSSFYQPSIFRLRVLAFFLVAVFGFIGFSSQASAGTIVASSGFEIDPDGFNFPNYSNAEGYQNLNAIQMQHIFGAAVCLTGQGKKCVLTSNARSWMAAQNTGMAGGHCFGFAQLTSIIKWNKLNRFGYSSLESAFGSGPFAYNLEIDKNVALQGAIARAFIAQNLPSMQDKTIDQTDPNTILAFLVKNMSNFKNNPYTFGIFQPGFEDGHEITPVSVEDMGGGLYDIQVYDNNWPGATDQILHINSNTNSWSYYGVNVPGYPQYLYQGNAQTKTLELSPVNPQLKLQDCPWCAGRQGQTAKFNQVTLSTTSAEHASLLIIDSKGRKLGIVGNKQVNQIPGARIMTRGSGIRVLANGNPANTSDSLEPIYTIPKNLAFRIKIQGEDLPYQDTESLGIVGPTFDHTINKLSIGKNQTAWASINPRNRTVSFTSSNGVRSSPFVSIGAQSKKNVYRINVSAAGKAKSRTLKFTKNVKKGLVRISSQNNTVRNYRISIDKFNTDSYNYKGAYKVTKAQVAYLNYNDLESKSGIAKVVIKNSKTGKLVKTVPIKLVK